MHAVHAAVIRAGEEEGEVGMRQRRALHTVPRGEIPQQRAACRLQRIKIAIV